jgi:E3 ubiquitin-protein ligase UBR1
MCLQEKPWFNQAISWKCAVCGTTPVNVAICLLCGERVCKNGACCRKPGGEGECSQHARARHADTGLFFDVQDNTVLIVRGDGGGCITKSPYIDAWGEEDVGLRRGRPVFFHAPILEELRRRFVCGGLVDKTVSTGMRLLLPSWRSF